MKKNEYTKTCNYPADALKIPESPDLERAVLGALMVFPESVADVRGILTSTAFYDPQNARIYDAICKLDDRGIFPDLYQVFEELKGTDISRQYLAVLTQAVGSGVGILNHARILVDKDIQRRGIFTLMEGIATIQEGPEGVMRVISSLERITGDVARIASARSIGDVMQDTLTALERRQQAHQRGECVGISTGLPCMDRITGGWRGGQLVILAARPAMGKTAFVLSMAKNMAVDYNTPVAIFSLEMSNLQLVNRLISNVCEIEGEKIKSGRLSRQEWEQLNSRVRSLFSAPLYVDDSPSLSILELRTKARRLVKEHGVKIIIIDYLQLMNATGMKFGSREQEVSMISRSLKQLAKELNIPVIALSQLSRKVEERNDGNKRPQLSDLRESGAIEQDADIVCFIHRPEYYTRSTTDAENRDIRGMAEFIVAKHRSGSVDDIEMTFVARFARFQNRSEPMPFEKGTMASKINDDPGPQEVYIPAPADGQPSAVDASAMGLGNDAQGGPMPDFLSE